AHGRGLFWTHGYEGHRQVPRRSVRLAAADGRAPQVALVERRRQADLHAEDVRRRLGHQRRPGAPPAPPARLGFHHRGAAPAAEITPVEPDPGHAGEGSGLTTTALTIAGSD